ncbi:unnamed protein product [Scytosiphon promiscuus]
MATADAGTTARSLEVSSEEYVEVYDEPMHPTVLENEFVRVLKVNCPSHQDTMLHRHSQDSFFLFFRNAKIRNEVVGKDPFEAELQAGSFYWGDHMANPIIHKVCVGRHDLDCMDVEIKADRPRPTRNIGPALPDTSKRHLSFENDVLRAYRATLLPGDNIDDIFAHHGGADGEKRAGGDLNCLAVAMKSAKLSRGNIQAGDSWWCDGISEDVSAADGGDAHGGKSWSNVGDQEEAEIMILQPK